VQKCFSRTNVEQNVYNWIVHPLHVVQLKEFILQNYKRK